MADTELFKEKQWSDIIRQPDWYLQYVALANEAKSRYHNNQEALDEFNRNIRHFFEAALLTKQVALGSEPPPKRPDMDAQRQPIDTIVIHHTSHTPGYRLTYMNAVQLLNIYAPYFANPTQDEAYLRGQPIWSGHFRDGQPSFIVYHHFMRMDGSIERLLDDDKIGWQAGNWDINTRSVGICLDNDYEKEDPTDGILRQLATFIKENYPQVSADRIIGHCEAREGTICPGSNFIGGWKQKLIGYVLHEASTS